MSSLRSIASGMGFAAGFCGVVLFLALSMPALESMLAPVSKYTSMEVVGREDDAMLIEMTGSKMRDCRLTEITALVRQDGEWTRAEIYINEQPMQLRSRPTGHQSFGVWKFKPPGDAVRLVAWHTCHRLWDTFTNLGEWPLPVK